MPDTPYITANGLTDVIERLAPEAFKGADVAVTANFPGDEPSVEFGITHLNESGYKGARRDFMTHVHAHSETIAGRLEAARNLARTDGLAHHVAVDDLGARATWPALRIVARPQSVSR